MSTTTLAVDRLRAEVGELVAKQGQQLDISVFAPRVSLTQAKNRETRQTQERFQLNVAAVDVTPGASGLAISQHLLRSGCDIFIAAPKSRHGRRERCIAAAALLL